MTDLQIICGLLFCSSVVVLLVIWMAFPGLRDEILDLLFWIIVFWD